MKFSIDFEKHFLIGDAIGVDLSTTVLMLHGAGQSHRKKMLPLRRELLELGIGSVSFDFIGHGETGGKLVSSSLSSRTRQACCVIKELGLSSKPLSIIGASMGAYNAVELTQLYPVECLILIVPAMYTEKAADVPFGPLFSELIRAPFSWRSAEGWQIMGKYRGRLLVIAAENDTVIPREIVVRYYHSAMLAASRELVTIGNTGHMVFTELRENNPEKMSRILRILCRTLLP